MKAVVYHRAGLIVDGDAAATGMTTVMAAAGALS